MVATELRAEVVEGEQEEDLEDLINRGKDRNIKHVVFLAEEIF